MVRPNERPDPSNRAHRGPLLWLAVLVVAGVFLGLAAYEIFESKRAPPEDRIWISDPHKDFHGPAPGPRRP